MTRSPSSTPAGGPATARRSRTRVPVELDLADVGPRFWRRTEARGDCLIWTGRVDRYGYGLVFANRWRMRAHRLAWWLDTKQNPGRLFVCHHCDVPACVRPEHLFLGTHTDNMRDMAAKGRGAASRPEFHRPRIRFTPEVIEMAMELRARGMSLAKVAAVIGLSDSGLHRALKRRQSAA